jgi:hypothetical protein
MPITLAEDNTPALRAQPDPHSPCTACETVAHCSAHGCVPLQPVDQHTAKPIHAMQAGLQGTDVPAMYYAAIDPAHPDRAWAIAVDRPSLRVHTAEAVAQWIREGAHVVRVDYAQAINLFDRWVDISHAPRATDTARALFKVPA